MNVGNLKRALKDIIIILNSLRYYKNVICTKIVFKEQFRYDDDLLKRNNQFLPESEGTKDWKKKKINGVTRKDNRRICTTDYLINLREHLFRETRFAMKM